MAHHRRSPDNLLDLTKVLINAETLPRFAAHGTRDSCWSELHKSYSAKLSNTTISMNSFRTYVGDVLSFAEEVADTINVQSVLARLGIAQTPKEKDKFASEIHGDFLRIRNMLHEGQKVCTAYIK